MVSTTQFVMVVLMVMLYFMEALGGSQYWHRINVSISLLDLETPRTSQVISDVVCARKSGPDPSINLFCYENTGNCEQYKTAVQTWQDPEAGPITQCWSRNTAPQPLDCEYDGSVYHHGEDDGCYYKCVNGKMEEIAFNPTIGNSCEAPFVEYLGGCYYYNYSQGPWCDARRACRLMNADLAVGPDFNTITGFITSQAGSFGGWVGVRYNKWLNGQKTNPENWHTDRPLDVADCVSIHIGYLKLFDKQCTAQGQRSTCQLF